MNPQIEHIFISLAHNYLGHHGGPAGEHPCISRQRVRLIAGRGIEGDRYALREPGHPKQITFFDMDILGIHKNIKDVTPYQPELKPECDA